MEVQRTEEDLFVEICLKYTFRGAHGENAKIKLLIRDGDVVFKYDILLKFGEQYIISIFLALDLVADIVVNSLTGNFPWVAGLFDLCFDCFV